MSDFHLMLAGDIGFAGGVAVPGIAVVDGDGAPVSTGGAGGFQTPTGIRGLLADGDGGFVVFGQQMSGFSGMARFLDDGTVDSSFSVVINAAFPLTDDNPSGSQGVYQAIQHEGGWLVIGNFTQINGVNRNGFARLSANGSVDTDWPSPNTNRPTTVAVQGGKAVISADNTLYRVDGSGVDGTFDPTTFPYSSLNSGPSSIYVDGDNKLVVAGPFNAVGGASCLGIQRVRADSAAPDMTIPDLQVGAGQINGVAAHDGGMLVFGDFTQALGGTVNRILRLNPDNSVDAGFTAPTIDGGINDALELASGKVLIAGTFMSVNSVSRPRVAVLNTDGTLDTGWVGPSIDNYVGHVHQAADGKIYIIGTVSSGFTNVGGKPMPAIARLNADGTHDAAYFGPVPAQANGSTVSFYQGVVPQSDGKFILWGGHDTIRGEAQKFISRVDEDGQTVGFADLNPNGQIYGVSELAGGKIIIVGAFTNIGGVASTYTRIARLNADGTLDTTYPPSTINGGTNTAGTGSRGIIELSSNRRLVYTTSSPYLYRLTDTGEIDGTYTAPALNGGADYAVRQSDGKIVLIGNFNAVGGDTRTRMCRLNADGTYDPSWADLGVNNIGTAPRLVALDDDRIVVINTTATFTIGGQSRTRLALLSADGVIDATWNPAPNSTVGQVKQQSDGKIIVSGSFTSIGGLSNTRLARLNSDGTADAGFFSYSYGSHIADFWVQSDDYIVHAGTGAGNKTRRVTANGDPDGTFAERTLTQSANKVLRLGDGSYLFGLSDGSVLRYSSVSAAMTWGGGATGGAILDIVPVASDSAFMIFGGFTTGTPKPHGRLTRINADGTLDTSYPGLSISPLSLSRVWIDGDDELLMVYSNQQRYRRTEGGTNTVIVGFPAGNNVCMTLDGKVYQTRSVSPFDIMRLNNDHTEDVGWGSLRVSGGSSSSYIPAPSGGVIVWGLADTPLELGGVPIAGVARLNADGSIDDTWAGAAYASMTPEKVYDAGSGKMYVCCGWTSAGQPMKSVFRLTSTGTKDAWISGGTAQAPFSRFIDIDTDYSVAGWEQSTTGTQRRVVKYDASGSAVAGYDQFAAGNLFLLNDVATGGPVRFLDNGNLLVTGGFSAVGTPEVERTNVAILGSDGLVAPDYDPVVVAESIAHLDVRGGKHYIGVGAVAVGTRRMPHVALREADGGYSGGFRAAPYINPSATSTGITATVNMVRALPDGRAYIGGRFATLGGGIEFGQGGYEISSLARILPDGSIDTSFGNARIEETDNPPFPQPVFPGVIRDIDIDADEALIVVGEFTMAGGNFSRPHICRVSDAGVLDKAFFVDINNPAWSVKVRGDGKIWVGGRFSQVNGSAQAGIVLLNADGTVDDGFANPLINVGTNQIVHTLLPQADGKLIAAGTWSQINSTSSKAIRRFNTDGSVDTDWDPAITTGALTAAAQAPGGKIYVASTGVMLRLNADGSIDDTWTNPFSGSDSIQSIVPMPEGQVLVGGAFILDGYYSNVLLNANGTVSPELEPLPLYHSDGSVAFVSRVSWTPTPPMAMFPRFPASRVYEGHPTAIQYRTYGGTKPYAHSLIGKLPDGLAMDGEVVEGEPAEPGTHYWTVVARDASGQRIEHLTRLQVAGADLAWPLFAFNADVTRIDPDGSNQTTVVSTDASVHRAYRLPNRKIVLLGSFSVVGGETRNKIALLNPDGTLDMEFTGPADFGDIVGVPQCADMHPNGKLYVGAERTSPTPYLGSLYRLNSDGTMDGTWSPDARMAMRSVQFVKVLEPNVVLVGGVPNSGTSSRFDGACVFLIDADGALDEDYISNLNPAWVGTLPDDFFTSAALQMYALDGGTIPGGATFTTGIYDVHVDENGDFVVCGSFTQRGFGGGIGSQTVARAYRTGGYDLSFQSQITGIVNPVNYPSRPIGRTLIPQPDGSFVVIGAFKEYGYTTTNTGYAHIDRNGSPATPPAQWADTSALPAYSTYGSALPDGRIIVATGDGHALRIFPDGELDSTFTEPAAAAAHFMPDNDGVDDFTGDGTFNITLELSGDPSVPVDDTESMLDSLLFASVAQGTQVAVLYARLEMRDTPTHLSDAKTAALSQLKVSDSLHTVLLHLIEDGLVLGDVATLTYQMIERAASRLLLSGQVAAAADAYAHVVTAMVLGEAINEFLLADATDEVAFNGALAHAATYLHGVLDQLDLDAAATATHTGMLLVEDAMLLGDAVFTESQLLQLIHDALALSVSLSLDNGQYLAWVVNAKSGGVSSYDNYPFNSFAKIGGRYYGATSTGVFRLEGDTDDGAQINARLRLGMSEMGTRLRKSYSEVYTGYTGDGQLLLRVIFTDDGSGQKLAAEYRMKPRPATGRRESRFEPGLGISAVYFDFELENINGADFDLSSVDFQPLVSNRRTRG